MLSKIPENLEDPKEQESTSTIANRSKKSDLFIGELEGKEDPEEKRKIIGELFIRVFEEEARKYGGKFLVQGTIAPDWIESGGGMRDTIKSHHNVGGLPEDMEMKLCEPIRELYKDEVRSLAEYLEVSVAHRQPFPGPGLAVRVMGEATPKRAEIVRQACHIVENELESAASDGKMELPWQYFAVLLPVKTVGVQGDVRAYSCLLYTSPSPRDQRGSRIPACG